jgi:nucleoside-diphosphate-sugar epimerase
VLQDFQDKVAVVTGAAGGIGRALARGFADEGMRVVAGDIDLAGAESTAQGLGAAARALAVDVADADSVAAFADACFDAFGQVDLLVNNAGVFQGGLSWERSVEDWDWTLGVNVYGIIHAIRSFVPRMIAQDTEGHIVNTASVAAFVAIGASVLTPSAFDTAIAETARVRPARFQRDDTPDGKGTAQALAAIVSKGRAPADVVAPVLDALRNGDFLIPTLPSFAAQIRNRYDALLERRLPDLIEVD